MKKILAVVAIVLSFVSCNNLKNAPNVENISIDISTERFERKLFDTSATSLVKYLVQLQSINPVFTNNFIQNILGITSDISADSTAAIVNEFVKSYQSFNPSEKKVLLDVRNPDECALGILPGSINIPVAVLQDRLKEIPMDSAVFIYCKGGTRAGKAAEILKTGGFTNIYFASETGYSKLKDLF